MFDRTTSYRQTDQIDVELTLAGRKTFDSAIYLMVGARLSDVLNDDRAFIPVQAPDGAIMVVAKSQIVSIVEKQTNRSDHKAKEDEAKPHFDPYKVLRIKPTASLEEIKQAYKKRIKAVHPDSVAAFELDEDLTRAAVLATQRVNHAYKIILKKFGEDPLHGAS